MTTQTPAPTATVTSTLPSPVTSPAAADGPDVPAVRVAAIAAATTAFSGMVDMCLADERDAAYIKDAAENMKFLLEQLAAAHAHAATLARWGAAYRVAAAAGTLTDPACAYTSLRPEVTHAPLTDGSVSVLHGRLLCVTCATDAAAAGHAVTGPLPGVETAP